MTLAREVVHSECDGRLTSRLATNALAGRVSARLRALGVGDLVESLERVADPLRERGGNAVLVRWREGVVADQIRGPLAAL